MIIHIKILLWIWALLSLSSIKVIWLTNLLITWVLRKSIFSKRNRVLNIRVLFLLIFIVGTHLVLINQISWYLELEKEALLTKSWKNSYQIGSNNMKTLNPFLHDKFVKKHWKSTNLLILSSKLVEDGTTTSFEDTILRGSDLIYYDTDNQLQYYSY